MNIHLTLTALPERFAICRLDRKESIPCWAHQRDFSSITYTREELSIVCPEEAVPKEVSREDGWRCFEVEGPLPFELTGILADLSDALSQERISIFAISTFDTDYILVKSEDFQRAIITLQERGHKIGCQKDSASEAN